MIRRKRLRSVTPKTHPHTRTACMKPDLVKERVFSVKSRAVENTVEKQSMNECTVPEI